jgi:hypothetical protein
VEKEMLREFYGLDLEGAWAYPEIEALQSGVKK